MTAALFLLIGATVLIAGRRAPVVLERDTIGAMQRGSVIIDIAIDQGGCVEGIRMTDSDTLYYQQGGITFSAVPNMPATVCRTASQALSANVRDYASTLAHDETTSELDQATAIRDGRIVDSVLAEEFSAIE